ncbi:hypothetical protein [Allorhodopirellula solitaria]|uniref:WW domain-containing protein n=1 Tax=Allorhodopirellula solitaria TaxID=2527987 RepID=A0A5C5X0F1_9BACT|nr:hypothetical protein [Allorhodopirellula solitaria]TWT56624.1 hypothetical protein CA85_41580 [Allorhodopirellula solitaria]
MRCTLAVVCFLLVSTYGLGQDANNRPSSDTPGIADLHARLEMLEKRVKELESDANVGRQSEGQESQPKKSNVQRDWTYTPTNPVGRPTRMRSVYWFPPQIWSSASLGQKPLPSPPPRGDVPDNWQEINYFGRWYYLVPPDETNVTPAPTD